MAVFRFIAAVFLLVAVIAVVSDAAPVYYGAGAFEATTIGGHWVKLAPGSLDKAEAVVKATEMPWIWSTIVSPLLSTPTFLAFGLLAAITGYIGRRRRTVQIFIN